MSKEKTNLEVLNHITTVIESLKDFLCNLVNQNIKALKKKADLICYWIKDWINYLSYEDVFKNKTHHKYKRGSILNVNFGFNIGSELGGLHLAIVIDKNDSIKKPMLTVIPLTSVKEHTDISKLSKDKLPLGVIINKLIIDKVSKESHENSSQMKQLDAQKDSYEDLLKLLKEHEIISGHIDQLLKMKFGSIAHIGQIKSISKLRIVSPTRKKDLLDNIVLPDKILDLIDYKIYELFLK